MNELNILLISAASLGFIHTLLGPDHYLPFIVLSKARKWSQSKTLWITFISGVGHIAGSVILGIIGVAMGISLNKLVDIESKRGSLVGWMLIVFGLLYSFYGVYKFLKNGGHHHIPKFLLPKKLKNLRHLPLDEQEKQQEDVTRITPWIIFLIFVFGPCEVLIPLLIYPAADHNTMGIIAVSSVFGAATILTMLFIVWLGYKGIAMVKLKNHEKYFHLIAGLVILAAGLGMQLLGW